MITESDAVNIFGGHSVRTMNMQTVRAKSTNQLSQKSTVCFTMSSD